MKKLLFFLSFCFASQSILAQGCCSGGSASPIAGGTSQGVLNEKQVEIATNFQYLSSNKFYAQDRDTTPMFRRLYSDYAYFRLAYGLSSKLTISLESGYYINRTVIWPEKNITRTSGIADIIIFPRYQVYYKCSEKKKTEFTLGLGYKIPIGSHDDSTIFYTDPTSGKNYYQTAPPTVQLTNGANDFIFYSFFFNSYLKKNFRVFANSIYVHKGWNSLGQKFGDYASISVFFGKTIFKRLGLTAQIKGEWVGRMKTDKLIDMVAYYNVYPASTGNRKVFIVPQISYSYKNLTVYALSEIPLYQYLNGSQVGSQYQFTSGISYKFSLKKKDIEK
ncbi:MAG: hypothetical protein HYR91_01380 [Flavobacteriia bacterium]|nr:hypothetical protein [Flavobacteriia bacterium]